MQMMVEQTKRIINCVEILGPLGIIHSIFILIKLVSAQ